MSSTISHTIRLNAMQRMMLQWSELHPYNACHVCRLRGAGDPDRLRDAARQVFRRNGLGVTEIEAGGRAYRAEYSEEVSVRVVPPEPNSTTQLEWLVAEELNRPFARPRGCPVRFVLVPGSGDAHVLVTTYDHWTADSISSRLLLRQILAQYLACSMPGCRETLATYDGTFRHAFSRQLRWKRLGLAASRAIGRVISPARIAQPAYSSMHDLALGYRLCDAPHDLVERLRHRAKSLEATVHDVILSALACTLNRHLPRRSRRDPCARMALATMVDARQHAATDLHGHLGTFLTYHVVRLSGSERSTLPEMIRQVTAQTARHKANGGHFDSIVDMKLLGDIWHVLPPQYRVQFLRRAFPLSGCVSNVVIPHDWFGDAGNEWVLDYHRASPAGPVAPLVITPTTYRDRLNIGVSYRATAFSRDRVDALINTFLELC
jgi:hypothetical protein